MDIGMYENWSKVNGEAANNKNKAGVRDLLNDLFGEVVQENQMDALKREICDRFGIEVGQSDNSFECYIPDDVMERMNRDEVMKKKVYAALENYTGGRTGKLFRTLNPPIKKCILAFDKNANVTATLKPMIGAYTLETEGDILSEIYSRYNVILDIRNIGNCRQFLDTFDMHCTNYVAIWSGALEKMKRDEVFRRKIFRRIEEFCSVKQQEKIRKLQPPVKSAGMIVYPDGRCMYWLEGYPENFGDRKERVIITEEQPIPDWILEEHPWNGEIIENNFEAIMQIMVINSKHFDRKNRYIR